MRIRKFNTVLVTTDKLKRHNELTNINTSIQKVEVWINEGAKNN